jgi:uncharacterized phage protein (TIGR01671 family)
MEQREIKFRAFEKSTNSMRDDFFIGFDGQLYDAVGKLDMPIMQWTGLYDKNKKPIYEGDLIKIPDNYDEFGMMAGEIREVYFNSGGFRLKPVKTKLNERHQARGHWLEDTTDFEVIGNKFQDQELLTK